MLSFIIKADHCEIVKYRWNSFETMYNDSIFVSKTDSVLNTQLVTYWLVQPDTSTAYHDSLIPFVFVMIIDGADLGPPLYPADLPAFPMVNRHTATTSARTATMMVMMLRYEGCNNQ